MVAQIALNAVTSSIERSARTHLKRPTLCNGEPRESLCGPCISAVSTSDMDDEATEGEIQRTMVKRQEVPPIPVRERETERELSQPQNEGFRSAYVR